jgi:hypothetical protein
MPRFRTFQPESIQSFQGAILIKSMHRRRSTANGISVDYVIMHQRPGVEDFHRSRCRQGCFSSPPTAPQENMTMADASVYRHNGHKP